MASDNRLLGSGKSNEVTKEEILTQKKAPAWRYHSICKTGKVVKTDKELKELDDAGWVDHPGKVSRLPGFEHLYEEVETADEEVIEEDLE